MKRLLSILLALTMLLSLAACGGGNDAAPDRTEPDQTEGPASPAPDQTAGEQSGPIVTGVSFPEGLESIEAPCVVGGELYAVVRGTHSNAPRLLCLSLADGSTRDLPDFRGAGDGQEGEYDYRLCGAIQPGADGTLWLEGSYQIRTQTGEGDMVSYHHEVVRILRQLDQNGGELFRLTVNEEELAEAVGLGALQRFLVDGDGDIFAIFRDGAAALDETGAARFTLRPKSNLHGAGYAEATVLGDGRLALGCMRKDDKGNQFPVLCPVDKDAGDWAQDQYQLDTTQFHDIRGLFPGDGSALFYYYRGDSIRAWRAGAEESEELLSLSEQGIGTGPLAHLSLLADGRLVLVTGNGYTPEETEVHLVDLERAAAGDGRTVLTYATLQMANGLDDQIVAFNKTDPDYRIEVTDYSQYGDADAARSRLITEISAGKMPDLLDTWAIPLEKWARRGYLEDLWPWIEGDPDLGREALMEKVFQASEIDGKLYEISGAFRIQTVAGARSLVGDRMTWTWEDMWDALESMPEGCVPMKRSQSSMLSGLMQVDPVRFLDQGAGTCSFDSDEFRSVLELCAGYPDDALSIPGFYDSLIYEGQVMLMPYAVTGFYFPQEARYLLHDDIAYVGMPNPWGEVGSQFSFTGCVAMSAACKAKEGAWAYIRQELLPGGRRDSAEDRAYTGLQGPGFPINRADMEALWRFQPMLDLEGQEIPGPDGQPLSELVNYYTIGRDPIPMVLYTLSPTQAQYRRFMDLYQSVRRVKQSDSTISAIITEAATPYFAEEATLDETVSQIQSRVTLYLGEQG